MDKERQLLIAMRKTLAEIAKDTSATRGAPHPLRQSTLDAMRKCFSLIAERERELAEAAGHKQNEYPRYADEPKTTHTASFVDMKQKPES